MDQLTLQSAPLVTRWLPLLFVVVIIWIVHRHSNGSLAHLPGPTISKWTNLRLKYAVVRGERARYVHALHQQYGPIVRTAPNECSVADIDAAKKLYKIGGHFLKSPWYGAFVGNPPIIHILAMSNPHEHAKIRKLTSANFSERWIGRMEPYIKKNVRMAVDRMVEEVKIEGFCDVFKWFTFMATDVIGESSFGESFRILETGKKNQYIHDLETAASNGVLFVELSWLFKIAKLIPFGPTKKFQALRARLNSYAQESIQRYWRQYDMDPDAVKPTLLTNAFAAFKDGNISKQEIEINARGFIVAGTDTTAQTATYAVWLLYNHPEIEKALIEEVAGLPDGFGDDSLRSLRLLDAVINETLRIRSPVSEGLPRTVPESGALFCNQMIPGGVTISMQAHTMHRMPEIWKDPERFDPSRWYDVTDEMRQSFLPFGAGSRVCLGRHLALLEVRHSLANFYRAFPSGVEMSTAKGFSKDDMTPLSYFLLPPKGKRCLMKPRVV